MVSINGSFAYDNVFLLNGVDINDNLFGTANNLYIEDALQELTVHTSGVSAEYGRFSGGVISAVTKSGGNTFQGSFRTDLTNTGWRDETRFQKSREQTNTSKTNKVYTATLGGPFVKDRLWFFGAYRREDLDNTRTLAVTGSPYQLGSVNRRYEGKLTGRISNNHTVQGNYIKNNQEDVNRPTINATFSIDEKTLVNRTLPSDLWVARYDGVLSPTVFVEAQWSRKTFGFRNSGGTSTDIFDSPFLSLGLAGIPTNSHYNAPYFDSTDPEDRNNNQYSAALSYFLSTDSIGRHDIKVGGERFTSNRTGGNSQSSTGYVFDSDPVVVGGTVQRDAAGNIIPNFVPGESLIENWLPLRGARIDIRTLSIYVNDRWQLNDHWTFNLGARTERHSTDASQAQISSVSSSVVVPRLSAAFDVRGDGRWVLGATYGHYAGKASETQFADNTNVGSPNVLVGVYNGPAGSGVDFAPGFDPANYEVVEANFPVQNVFLDDGLKTPITKEWTVSAGTKLGSRGEFKTVYIHRNTDNFIEDFITLDGGTTTIVDDAGNPFGVFDNRRVGNSDLPSRRYQALQFEARYRLTANWALAGNLTTQLKNEANFEGELANQPGISSIIGDYPEIYPAERFYPIGTTDDYQKHKARIWTVYNLGLGRGGDVALGVLFRLDSALRFSLTNTVATTAAQRALGAGYASLPAQATLFYEGRGSGEFEGSKIFDFTLNYELPIFKTARPFFKAELRNAFNKQPLIGSTGRSARSAQAVSMPSGSRPSSPADPALARRRTTCTRRFHASSCSASASAFRPSPSRGAAPAAPRPTTAVPQGWPGAQGRARPAMPFAVFAATGS